MLASATWRSALRNQPWKRATLALLSGVLFSLSFLHPALFGWCWVALIPLLWSLHSVSVRQAYVLGALSGLSFYACGTYWVSGFIATLKGYGTLTSCALALLFWLYSAQASGLVAALFVWLRTAKLIHPAWLFALVFVAVYSVFPVAFPIRPGESQSNFITALQGVELTGVYGLDFLIVLTSASLYCLLEQEDVNPCPLLLGLAVLVGWFGFGLHAQSRWYAKIAATGTLRIGWVQPDERPNNSPPEPPGGYTRAYPLEMALTEELAAQGAQVVVWPETRQKGWFFYDHVRRSLQHQIAALQTPVIFQDNERVSVDGVQREYNSAAFVDRQGRLAGKYRKIQRMAFGEYLPLVSDTPVLNDWVTSYLGDFFSPLARGEGPTVFQGDGWAMVPMICYEAMFPALIADSMTASPQGKMLVAMSNDGWFGATRQPYIHLHSSVLRAVEHRSPLLHVLNNGPSAYITPDGRFFFQSELQTAGGYLLDVPYSTSAGGSFFSRHPYWFIGLLYATLISIVLRAAWLQWRRRYSTG